MIPIFLRTLLAASFLLMPPMPAGASHSICWAPQAPGSVAESSAALQNQLEAILTSAKKGNQQQFRDLIGQLRMPEGANWFAATFGDELGKSLASAYESSYKDYEETVSRIFIETSKTKHTHLFIQEFSESSSLADTQFMRAVLADAKGPVRLYTASAGKDRPTDALPGLYVYVDGIFRIINFRTFYRLPNVKPIRVSFAPAIAQQQLIYWTKPVPPAEAFQKRTSVKVDLHIIVDRDGNVAQAQVLSGPQELGNAAIEAVRQWRYRPTFLNGDPVEVDTTVTISFALHN